MKYGFLAIARLTPADLIVLLELAMGACLLIGAVLARRKRYRGHAWCQSMVVLLNLVVIVVTMVPSFRDHVAPKIPAKLARTFYFLATVHAAIGGVAELAALYILLAAGTEILPKQLLISDYKTLMRTVLITWWLALALGLATYAKWYGFIRF
jgi:hypothetical protein